MSGSWPRRCEYCQNHPKGPLNCSLLKRPHLPPHCRNCTGKRQCIDPAQRYHVIPFAHQRSPYTSLGNTIHTGLRRSSASSRTGSEHWHSPSTMDRRSEMFFSPSSHRKGSEHTISPIAERARNSLLGQNDLLKVIISLDVGSGNVKASWTAVYRATPQRALCDRLIVGCEHITWQDNSYSCPAKLAYWLQRNEAHQDELIQIWGIAVEDALRDDKIRQIDVLQWLKPALFSTGTKPSFHEIDLGRKLTHLAIQHNVVNLEHFQNLNSRRLYSDLLRHVYGYVLKEVSEKCPGFSHLCRINPLTARSIIEVALPVPANALGIHEMMVLEAAKRAGLPNPFPVAEPAAAIAFVMQSNFEGRLNPGTMPRPSTGTVLLLDAGEGSLDAIVCTVKSGFNPDIGDDATGGGEIKTRHILKEELQSLSRWQGGSSVNDAFRAWVETAHQSLICDIFERNLTSITWSSRKEIVDFLVRNFERRKKRFSAIESDYNTTVTVSIRGCSGTFIEISRHKMIEFFNVQLKASFELVDELIRKLQGRIQVSARESRIDQIILVGGANESGYIKDQMRKRYEARIPVVCKTDYGHTSTAKGGLLIAIDKSFIAERFVLHSYFFKWDQRTSRKRSCPDGRLVVKHDEATGVQRVQDVSRLVLKAGDRVTWNHTVKLKEGIRTLPMERPSVDAEWFDHRSGSFIIEEDFFMSDVSSANGLNTKYAPNGFHKVGTLKFRISRAWCERNWLRILNNKYWQVDYQVSVTLVGMNMTFCIIIPENGVFEEGQDSEAAIKEEGQITWNECGGFWKV